VGIAI